MRPTLTPRPDETQAAFAVRFHETMRGSMPQTDLRNEAMFDAWESSGRGPGDPLVQKAAKQFPPEKYQRVARVPIFAEHETTEGPEKTPVKYSRDDLAAIIDRCNKRISDTGNFAPISDGHTPTRQERSQGKSDPDVLGYSGPFSLGMIGNENPRYAIFCDEHHRNDRFDRSQNMPYRSPEVWLEQKKEDRFFHPIAALSTQAPRLELGMAQYERDGESVEVERYSAAAFPAAASVTIPNSENYDAGDSMDPNAAPDQQANDTNEIVNAILESEPMQWVLRKMQEEGQDPAAADPAAGDGGLPPANGAPVGDAPAEPVDPAPVDEPAAPAAEDPAAPQPAADPAPAPAPAAEDPTTGMADDEREEYASLSPDGQAGYMKARARYMGTAHYSKSAEDVANDRVLRENYERLEAEVVELRKERDTAKADKRTAERRERYSKLREKGFVLDVDKELERTKSFDDAAYETHLTMIAENYQRAPLNEPAIPVEASPAASDAATENKHREATAKAAERYCLEQRQAGNSITFAEALAHVKANS
jgi:hypothetical protein